MYLTTILVVISLLLDSVSPQETSATVHPLETLDNVTIYSCFCPRAERYTAVGTCVTDEELGSNPPPPDHFHHQIRDLVCQNENETAVVFQNTFFHNDPLTGDIYIDLMGLALPPDMFCAEKYRDVEGTLKHFIKVCLPPPRIPKCCSNSEFAFVPELENFSDNSSIGCLNDGSKRFKPGLNEMELYIDYEFETLNSLDFYEFPISCPPHHSVAQTVIGNDESSSFLSYDVNGAQLQVLKESFTFESYSAESFCLDESDPGDVIGFYCNPDHQEIHQDICEGKTCIRKCCAHQQAYDVECFDLGGENSWLPPMHDDLADQIGGNSSQDIEVFVGFPRCSNHPQTLDESIEPFFLLQSGELFVPSYKRRYSHLEYCVEQFYDDASKKFSDIAVVCFDEESEAESNVCFANSRLLTVLLCISCFFIVATLIVYLSVEEILRRLPSKCIVSESISLLACFVSIITVQSISKGDISAFCIVTGKLH